MLLAKNKHAINPQIYFLNIAVKLVKITTQWIIFRFNVKKKRVVEPFLR